MTTREESPRLEPSQEPPRLEPKGTQRRKSGEACAGDLEHDGVDAEILPRRAPG